MIIYHTSNLIVSEPDVYHSRHHLDFGDGMYLTPLDTVEWVEPNMFVL
jgi:hypothetical protein